MEVNVLQEKVNKAEEKVAKCAKTIERHHKSLDKKNQVVLKKGIVLDLSSKQKVEEVQMEYRQTDLYWEISEVKGKVEDIRGATKKLQDAEQILENWKEKLNKEIEKERFIDGNAPQVIKDFLEEWKKLAYEWHVVRFDAYQRFKKQLNEARDAELIEFVKSNPEEFERYLENGEIHHFWTNNLQNIRGKGLSKHLELNEFDYSSMQQRRNQFAGGTVLHMDEIYNKEERLAWLEKTIEAEKKAKMIDLINRIRSVVGNIMDAKDLKVSPQGNLDGIIIGEEGSAKINTVGCGGWNIQCWHYRILIKEL